MQKGTEISGTSDSGFAAAVAAAQNSDVAILALGESSDMSGEAASRAYLDLPGNQQQLLEAVVATGKPVVLLIFSGRPLVSRLGCSACACHHGSLVPWGRNWSRDRRHAYSEMSLPAASSP